MSPAFGDNGIIPLDCAADWISVPQPTADDEDCDLISADHRHGASTTAALLTKAVSSIPSYVRASYSISRAHDYVVPNR